MWLGGLGLDTRDHDAGIPLARALFPKHLEAVVRPGGQEVGLAGDPVAIGSAPLRPIRGLGRRRLVELGARQFGKPIRILIRAVFQQQLEEREARERDEQQTHERY